MKRIVSTLHAEAKLQERSIRRAWVERVLRNPLWTEPEPRHPEAERRFGRVAEFGDRVLRVVCVETNDTIRVITATFDRGARSGR